MYKEALYYSQLENNKVKCTLCPHKCILSLNKKGLCKTRQNIDGKLYSLSYSNLCAANVDPIEKKPLYHFFPGSRTFSIATAGCNLTCKNCQNSSISQVSPIEIPARKLSPKQVVELALSYSCDSISYTYTDPVVYYEYALDTAIYAKKNGLKNVLVTAGYIEQQPLKEILNYIDAVNVDLKSFSDDIYREVSGVSLTPVLNTLKTIKDSKVWLEITNLLIPTVNDSEEMLTDMCNWLKTNGFEDVPLHFSKFYPTYKLLNIQHTSTYSIEKAIEIAVKTGLKFVYSGNIHGHINEKTKCYNCGNVIIDRVGYSIKDINLKEGKCLNCGSNISGVWTK